MKKIKFLSNKTIKLEGDIYKPYIIGNLPPSFGFKNQVDTNGDIKKGISEWFNYKGLTYVLKSDNPWA